MASTPTASFDARTLLLALLVDLAADKNFKSCFKAAHRDLHHFFWTLKQEERSRPFVQDLLFDTNGNYPHSEQIDELLQELQLSGVLTRPNPTYRYNDIAITRSSAADQFRKRLSLDQEGVYKDILKRFQDNLGVREA
jgi:hypothetical protein